MTRISAVNPENATGETKDLFEAVQKKLGVVPNMVKHLGNAPAALNTYLGAKAAVGKGIIDARTREKLALVVGEENNCGYCLAAHTLAGKNLSIDEEALLAARKGVGSDAKENALLKLARDILEHRGAVPDATLTHARESGVTDAEITETVAVVALNVFTNYFNRLAQTDLDFPAAPPLNASDA